MADSPKQQQYNIIITKQLLSIELIDITLTPPSWLLV